MTNGDWWFKWWLGPLGATKVVVGVSDDEMKPLCGVDTEAFVREVLRDLPNATQREQLMAVMKRSKGACNPAHVLELLEAPPREIPALRKLMGPK